MENIIANLDKKAEKICGKQNINIKIKRTSFSSEELTKEIWRKKQAWKNNNNTSEKKQSKIRRSNLDYGKR